VVLLSLNDYLILEDSPTSSKMHCKMWNEKSDVHMKVSTRFGKMTALHLMRPKESLHAAGRVEASRGTSRSELLQKG
jgi:hypothetical protein